MSILIFPTLAGQGWSVHKKPRFASGVAVHVSGRETRRSRYAQPLYDFELTFDGLDMSATGIYGGLGATSMQTLAGFYMACQGRANPFLYVDPSDRAVVGQAIGAGDGATTVFTLTRTMGGYYAEPVSAVTGVSAVYLNGVAATTASYVVSQPNILTFVSPPGAGVAITADFTYGFSCRFAEDVEDFEEFMAQLSAVKTLAFTGVRDVLPIPPSLVVEVFEADTTWTAPQDLDEIVAIEGIGGGGGGAGTGASAANSMGGGGGGGYAIANASNAAVALAAITPGTSHTIVIGAGGAGGVPGASGAGGGDSSFDSIMIARGGQGALDVVGGDGGGNPRNDPLLNVPSAGSHAGGDGSAGSYSALSVCGGGGGGGGAAGPNGPGGWGGAGSSRETFPNWNWWGGGGGGGGGADGGAQPAAAYGETGTDESTNPLEGSGGSGGAAGNGTPGGAGGAGLNGGSIPAGAGAKGSGGGGGYAGTDGANGGDGDLTSGSAAAARCAEDLGAAAAAGARKTRIRRTWAEAPRTADIGAGAGAAHLRKPR